MLFTVGIVLLRQICCFHSIRYAPNELCRFLNIFFSAAKLVSRIIVQVVFNKDINTLCMRVNINSPLTPVCQIKSKKKTPQKQLFKS